MRIVSPILCVSLFVGAFLPLIGRDGKARAVAPQPSTRTFAIAARDGLVYVGQTGGLMIRDVSDPTRPLDLSWLPLPASVSDVVMDGSRAYLAAGTRGLVIVDIEDPRNPEELARLDTDGKVKRLALAGEYMFVADGASGLLVVDLSSTDSPRIVARISTRGDVRALAVHGERLAIAEGHGGVRVFDVRRPDNPRVLRRLETRSSARDLCWIEERLFVASGSDGTAMFEPAESARPLEFLPPVRSAQHVACGEQLVAVSNSGSAIQLFDVSGTGAAEERSRLRVHRTAPIGHARFEGARLWIAADIAGMGLLDVADAGNPERVLPRRREFKVSF